MKHGMEKEYKILIVIVLVLLVIWGSFIKIVSQSNEKNSSAYLNAELDAFQSSGLSFYWPAFIRRRDSSPLWGCSPSSCLGS